MSNARLEPGFVVADRYRVEEPLGEGGMGVVYRAEHMHMRKSFALKVLHRELLRLPEVVARFEREAILAGSIEHANVAAATDFGKLPDGSFYLVLELVQGLSLRDEIAKGPMEIVRAHSIMRGMTAGIAAAHAKGIVHRDLKPENVMLVERDGAPDFVKVLDFGIAKGAAAEVQTDSPLTQAGTIMGTPQYMAPEQALGQTVDQRSDLYALGVIFYEMVTGNPPFSGEPLIVLRHHIATPPAPLAPELTAGVTVPIADVILKLLAKDPADRYQTAAELAIALESPASIAAVAPPVVAEADRATPPPPPRRRARKVPVIPLVAAGAALLGIGLVVAFSRASTPPAPSMAEIAAPVSEAETAAPAETASAAADDPAPTETGETAETPPPEPAPTETAPAPAPSPAARTASNETPASQNSRTHGQAQGKVYRKPGPIRQLGQDFKHLFGK